MKKMKAIIISENKELIWADSEKPEILDNEVLIKIKATAVNRADVVQKNGFYPPPLGASEILGLECSGIIEAIGKNVKKRKVGEQVCALLAGGGYAQYASCPEEQAIPTPEGISLTNSASLPEVFATCWLNLFHEANMQENDIVLLHAGASGIGTAAIQLCNLFNCKSFVTASTHEKISYCIKLGAENGSLRSNKPFDDVKNWAPDGVDIILDPVGGSYFQDNLNVLSIEGRLLLIGLMGGTKSEINLGQVLMKRQKIIGSTIRARSSIVKGKVMNDLLEKVWPHFKSKKIKPIIYKTMSIENANQAHEIMEKDENIGKLVLEIN
ncbi:MAG: NAD(P)H-quinone oxidoreductase [Hyphomicrobiales bacterium]|jgi:putative PIG3 family NAD(P)H quinone oxidoreductase|nr:NAD(P)H-quinone oxidoreductase [Hyphomicrobiales bacterium]MDG1665118.1 NAD(P)H-quinone oxidoreductase [Hyphomicrobiales bacterium]